MEEKYIGLRGIGARKAMSCLFITQKIEDNFFKFKDGKK